MSISTRKRSEEATRTRDAARKKVVRRNRRTVSRLHQSLDAKRHRSTASADAATARFLVRQTRLSKATKHEQKNRSQELNSYCCARSPSMRVRMREPKPLFRCRSRPRSAGVLSVCCDCVDTCVLETLLCFSIRHLAKGSFLL